MMQYLDAFLKFSTLISKHTMISWMKLLECTMVLTAFLPLAEPKGLNDNYFNGCYCPTIYDPVCGYDARTYSSLCQLKCTRYKMHSMGSCPRPVEECSLQNCLFLPKQNVCGVDGRKYANECAIKCFGIDISMAKNCD
ncbi:hypothetical protein CHS0354_001087 [Potamilus streckersoni]|uniref:Kazal-like domain-containing protein n=1 Tax=Potamilus streckersoni TaxID=2493646 RepID=A0AAE0VK13_9BIVA|nr:hypothetical protein CHS0354_001087 [Potamilus streckersoni]